MNGAMIFRQEKFRGTYPEMVPIVNAHYKEISFYTDISLDPDLDEYYRMEDAGILKLYTIREYGQLIGYAVYFLRKHLHYKSSLQAYQDVVYISKEKRGFGKSFIEWCDEELRKLGVQVVNHHVKYSHDWSEMLVKIGYEFQDKHLSKRLDK